MLRGRSPSNRGRNGPTTTASQPHPRVVDPLPLATATAAADLSAPATARGTEGRRQLRASPKSTVSTARTGTGSSEKGGHHAERIGRSSSNGMGRKKIQDASRNFAAAATSGARKRSSGSNPSATRAQSLGAASRSGVTPLVSARLPTHNHSNSHITGNCLPLARGSRVDEVDSPSGRFSLAAVRQVRNHPRTSVTLARANTHAISPAVGSCGGSHCTGAAKGSGGKTIRRLSHQPQLPLVHSPAPSTPSAEGPTMSHDDEQQDGGDGDAGNALLLEDLDVRGSAKRVSVIKDDSGDPKREKQTLAENSVTTITPRDEAAAAAAAAEDGTHEELAEDDVEAADDTSDVDDGAAHAQHTRKCKDIEAISEDDSVGDNRDDGEDESETEEEEDSVDDSTSSASEFNNNDDDDDEEEEGSDSEDDSDASSDASSEDAEEDSDDDEVHGFSSSLPRPAVTAAKSSSGHRNAKKDQRRKGSLSAQQPLTTKISREGDLNIKVLFLTRKTSFRQYVKDVMFRFGYEQPTDFDMYCIDPSGDRIDIDVDRDFSRLTKGFWERLDAAAAAAKQKQKEVARDSHRSSSSNNNSKNGAVTTIASGKESRNASKAGKPGGRTALTADHVSSSIQATSPNERAATPGSDPSDKSSGSVIRLYVRDSHAYALRRQQQRQFQQLLGGQTCSSTDALPLALSSVGSPTSLRLGHIVTMGSSIGSTGTAAAATTSSLIAPHSKFLAAIGRANAGDDGMLVEELVTPSSSRPVTSQMESSPGNLSLQFAETQRSVAGKTFQFEEDKEVVWTRMSILGKGSFGTVYEGITSDGKIMAVKVQELSLDDDAEETRALATEINLMRSLKHKNIVAYYGCQTRLNEENGSTKQMEVFLELCHGGSLSQLRRKFERAHEPFAISLVRAYTSQILEGLAYLHSRGVMHRDLKSDNVLISAMGEAKLADFGCSKRTGGTHTLTTGGGVAPRAGGGAKNNAMYQTLVGSPFFMAPEVMLQGASGQNGADAPAGYSMAADIWSVGCLVVELLGREPWSFPNSSNVFQLMYKISQAKGMPTGVPAKEICPPLLYGFFERCFERNPSKRATAAELLKHEWILCPDSRLQEVPPHTA